jgi:hypothetical protein
MGNSVTSDVPKVSPSEEGPRDDELPDVFTHRDPSHATDTVEFIDRSVADLLTGFKNSMSMFASVGHTSCTGILTRTRER